MKTENDITTLTEVAVEEMPQRVVVKQPGITLGLPRNPEQGERRFPLTPEAVRTLVDDYRFKVFMESGAGHEIHYSDNAYASHGAIITDRPGTMAADIVIAAAALQPSDIKNMRRNATLWTVMEPCVMERAMLTALNQRAITTMSLTALQFPDGHRPVADILDEIDGRAAIAVASGFLADGVHGKGILLGGVAGIVPCEVVINGAGTAGMAAARSALGLGATVRLFDNNPCRLRQAEALLQHGVIGSSLHRKVYLSALRSADIVVNTLTGDERYAAVIDAAEASALKKGAIMFDLNRSEDTVFPSLRVVDLSPASESMPWLTERICFVNAGRAVPRTSAMALSNAIVPLLSTLAQADEHTFMDAVRMNAYLGTGLVTFGGKVVNREAALAAGMKWVDPNIFLRLS